MERIQTHYDTLKVARDAPTEVIKSAYRALARKYHPDSNPDLEEAVKAMQALNQAFEVLIDPSQRKEHDDWIDQQSAETASATNEKTKKTGKFPQGGEFRAKWPQTDKLAPGTVVGIIAVAAALIALVIIALDVQSRSSSKNSPSSESTPGFPASPTPASTPLAVVAPTPTPAPTPALSPEPVDKPNSEAELIPGIPNAWIIKHSLSPVDSNLPTNDPDKDGSANIEEFHAGSNPVDGNSRPPAWTKLRLVSTKADKLRIKFVSLPSGDLETVQINTLSTENPRVVTGASRFYKKGDMIVMSETRPDGREVQTPTLIKLTEIRRVKRFNPTLNLEELMPAITVKNISDGLELQLAQGEVKDSPYTLSTLRDTRSGKEFTLRTGETFDLDDGQTYKLIEASEKHAGLQSLTDGERLGIPRLEPDAVVRPTPSATPKAALIVTPTPAPIASPTPTPASTPIPDARRKFVAYSEAINIDFGVGGAQRQLRKSEGLGIFRSSRWNTASGPSGAITNPATSQGKKTASLISWSSNNLYQVQDVSTGGNGGNFTMMFGYLDTSNTSTTEVRVENLPESFVSDGYDLIVYVDGSNGSQSRVGRYEVVVPGSESVTKFVKDGAGQSFDGKFVEADVATAPTTAVGGVQGNAIVFRNIKSREFVLLAKGEIGEGFNRAPVNGMQIAKRKEEVVGLPGSARTQPTDPQAASNSMCLTELTPVEALLYGDLMVNRYDGPSASRIVVDRKLCDRYIFAHAPSRLVYKIPPGFRQFTAVGIKPSGDRNIKGDWVYIVRADGEEVFRSGKLADEPSGQIKVSASLPLGAQTLELIVEDLQSNYADHSIWAYPTLE